jgi:hypothetical protein
MCPRTLFVSTFDTRGPVDCHLCVDCDDQTAPALWRLLRRRRVSSRQKHVQAKNQAPRNSRHTCFPLRGVRMQFKGFKCKTDFPTLMWCDVMWSHLTWSPSFNSMLKPSILLSHTHTHVLKSPLVSCCASFTYFLYFVSSRDWQIFYWRSEVAFALPSISQWSKEAIIQASQQSIDHLFCFVKKNWAKFALMDD